MAVSDWPLELTREAYGRTLVELGQENPRIVVLDADLAVSTLTKYFRDAFPDRFFEMGIAEQNMVGVASGLALEGYIPFLSSYAMFLSGRAYDQIRQDVDYQQTNVKLAAAHGGISVGQDGPTHQSMEDLAALTAMVNMTVIVPADFHQTKKLVRWAAAYDGPVYFRMGREKVPMITDESTPFEYGKMIQLVDGTDCTIIATGLTLFMAMEAQRELATEGISVRVLNAPFLKPIDETAILKAAQETGCIVTAEEHNVWGGLGSIVARVVVGSKHLVPVEIVGINNMYLSSGPWTDLMEVAGLTTSRVKDAVRSAMRRRDQRVATV
ncbi:MAG: 1-deoxy-D-xylulose-5-phosphate synthase [bacterium]|nr:1-deoxy-D-xylulose-5-phosphate synthase [bacterium]